jgi:Mg-chelatase subunit ChlD
MVDLAKVAQYDFVVLVDKSGSMATKDVKSGWFGSKSRWEAIEKTAIVFAQDLEKIDKDGIGLVLFGGDVKAYPNSNADQVAKAFSYNSPGGGTPLAEALQTALDLLKDSKKKKFIMVFTDGAPNNRQAVKNLIINQANGQSTDDECTILFVQVGNDTGATKFLTELDDDLKGAKFDIVDAKTAAEAEKFSSTLELVVHAIGD